MKKKKKIKTLSITSQKVSEAAALMGFLGGRVKSKNKKISSRENGKLGGRPPRRKPSEPKAA